MGVSVGAGRGVPEDGDGLVESDATRAERAVAVALMLRSSSSIEVAADGGEGAARRVGRVLGTALADGAADRGGTAGVTGCTWAGGAGESARAGAGDEIGAPAAGTGVAGSGVKVAVGVLPLIVELTIWRVATAVGAGRAGGAIDPNTPNAWSSTTTSTSATAARRSGTTNRCQAGGGLRSVTRQARGLALPRLTDARGGTCQRYRSSGRGWSGLGRRGDQPLSESTAIMNST